VSVSCCQNSSASGLIKKGKLTYDFTFAELAIKYLETEDSTYLFEMANLKATEHIFKHANQYKYNVPRKSKLSLVKYLLTPIEEKRNILVEFKRNLEYAKRKIAIIDFPQQACQNYLPHGFEYTGNLFFTFGYDLGVVFDNNASLNLAHPNYLKDMNEIRYYALHELHHAGFFDVKDKPMPSLDILNFKEMAEFIEILTHLEGMGTYVPLALREQEGAMNADEDYVCLQNKELMKTYGQEYFEIYNYFKKNPDRLVDDKDWKLVAVLSNKRRLWYRVGALMAQTIEDKIGRDKLVNLIAEPSKNFIETYLEVK